MKYNKPFIYLFILLSTICGYFIGLQDNESWQRGYSECMDDVVKALVAHDEVYLGNLVVNEPNAVISDITFFVIDPNQWAAEINACNVTVSNGTWNGLAQK